MTTPPLTSHTVKLDADRAEKLRLYLVEHGFVFKPVPYAAYGAAGRDVNVVYYTSGKLVVQGKGTREFVEFVLEPEIVGEARIGYEAVLDPEFYAARIGVDESGKGDFFGPLCVAGVYVNERVLRAWADAGVKDSKQIGSDRRIVELAKVIKETAGCVVSVVPIGNPAYNRLQAKLGSVNQVLAWGHARVIENLLADPSKLKPMPVRAISDQFARDKATVARALMGLGRQIELVQRHRAEADLAVAAASILARNEFVLRLKRMKEEYGMEFPKGASTAVEEAARQFVEKHGPDRLGEVAKMHFRTSFRVLGLPEPPKKEFRG